MEFEKLEDEKLLNMYNWMKDKPREVDKIRFGFSIKFAYHIVRLLNEVEQILIEHDLDLERNREQLKSIRRGDWTLEEIEYYFNEKELLLEKKYSESALRHSADEDEIKTILLNSLEMHFGSMEKAINLPNKNVQFLNQANELIENVLRRMI